MRHFRYALAALACWCLNPASAATLTVTTDADELNSDGDCSLREAIEAANTNAAVDGCGAGDEGADTIVFAASLDDATITVDAGLGGLRTLEAVTIDGAAGDGRVSISGGDAVRVLLVREGMLTLRNATVRDGLAGRGAGVFISSGAMFTGNDVDFVENVATGAGATDGGAGLYVSSGTTATLTDCSFEGNAASGTSGSGGGILNNGGTLVATGSSFEGNSASRAGGAIEAAGASTTTLTDTDFEGNQTGSRPGNGGAFHISATGSATITGGTVSENEAANEGGGFWNNTGTMTLSEVTFTNNVALGDSTATGGPVGGGAVFNNGGTLVATDITASNNTASGFRGSGGAFMGLGGTMTLNGGTISDNTANRAGAGIENAGGTIVMTDVTVSDNSIPSETAAPGNGGGLHSGGGTVTVNGGTFSGNQATEGGGLWANRPPWSSGRTRRRRATTDVPRSPATSVADLPRPTVAAASTSRPVVRPPSRTPTSRATGRRALRAPAAASSSSPTATTRPRRPSQPARSRATSPTAQARGSRTPVARSCSPT